MESKPVTLINSDPEYGFILVSGAGSGFSNFIVLGFHANTIIKRIFAKI